MVESLLPASRRAGVDVAVLAQRLENYSGSDVRLLCKEASMKPIRRLMKQLENMEENATMNWHVPAEASMTPKPGSITMQDFEEAIQSTNPASVAKQAAYEEWFSQFGSV
jgi:katanin p60 ATPase-containing subunit A1